MLAILSNPFMRAAMKSMFSNITKGPTSSSTSSSLAPQNEKPQNSENSKKPDAPTTARTRAPKGEQTASHSMHAAPKPAAPSYNFSRNTGREAHTEAKPTAAASEKSSVAGKPEKRERKEKKKEQSLGGLFLNMVRNRNEPFKLPTALVQTAGDAAYAPVKMEQEAMQEARKAAARQHEMEAYRQEKARQRAQETPTDTALRRIQEMCMDTVQAFMTRHSLTMKEVMTLARSRFSPEDLKAMLHTLAERGDILIDEENPNYVFLPVPAEIKALDQSPRSSSSSSSSLEYPSDASGSTHMPAFFARMGKAERQFYERDSVAVLLSYVITGTRYTSLPRKASGNVLNFSIPASMLEQAARNEDPGIGIHPYLIPKAIQLLEKESICEPHEANAQELHFSGTNKQLYPVMHKYSYQQSTPY